MKDAGFDELSARADPAPARRRERRAREAAQGRLWTARPGRESAAAGAVAVVSGGLAAPAAETPSGACGESGRPSVALEGRRRRPGDSSSFPCAHRRPRPLELLVPGAERTISPGSADASSRRPRPRSFTWKRDAGTFSMEGRFQNGEGAGHFAFAASPTYLAEQRRGYGDIDEEKAMGLALHDVSRAFIEEMAGLGYKKLSLDELVSCASTGRRPSTRAGSPRSATAVPVDDLLSFRIHGVNPDYMRDRQPGLRAARQGGPRVDAHPRGHARYVRSLKTLGYGPCRSTISSASASTASPGLHPSHPGQRRKDGHRRAPRLHAHPRRGTRVATAYRLPALLFQVGPEGQRASSAVPWPTVLHAKQYKRACPCRMPCY